MTPVSVTGDREKNLVSMSSVTYPGELRIVSVGRMST